MSATEILNAVAVVRSYLLEQDAVTALVGSRISHKSPGTFNDQWVRITQLDATNETGSREVEHLVAYYLQIDSYAGDDNKFTEAFDLAAAVRSALVDITKADLDGAVATDSGFTSMPSVPDQDLKPARERFILDAEIFMHPKP